MSRVFIWELTQPNFLLKMQNLKPVARAVNWSEEKKPNQNKNEASVNWGLVRN